MLYQKSLLLIVCSLFTLNRGTVYNGEDIVIGVRSTPFTSKSDCETHASTYSGSNYYTINGGWNWDDVLYWCVANKDHGLDKSSDDSWKSASLTANYVNPSETIVVQQYPIYGSYINSYGYVGGIGWRKELTTIFRGWKNYPLEPSQFILTLNYNNEEITRVLYNIERPSFEMPNIVYKNSKPKKAKDCYSSDTSFGNIVYACATYRWVYTDTEISLEIGYEDSNGDYIMIDEEDATVGSTRHETYLFVELSGNDLDGISNHENLEFFTELHMIDEDLDYHPRIESELSVSYDGSSIQLEETGGSAVI